MGDVTADVVNATTLHLKMDNANMVLVQTVYKELADSLDRFGKYIITYVPFEVVDNYAEFPIQREKAYYSEEINIIQFIGPGVLIGLTYFLSLGLTAIAFVVERLSGALSRTLVIGVKHIEIVLAFVAVHAISMLVQICISLGVYISMNHIPIVGNLFLVFLLVFLQGLTGLTFGLVISGISASESAAGILVISVFMPTFTLTGIWWPLEAMHPYLYMFSQILPQTRSVIGLRAVMSRGAGILDPDVILAMVVPTIWSIGQIAMGWFLFKRNI